MVVRVSEPEVGVKFLECEIVGRSCQMEDQRRPECDHNLVKKRGPRHKAKQECAGIQASSNSIKAGRLCHLS